MLQPVCTSSCYALKNNEMMIRKGSNVALTSVKSFFHCDIDLSIHAKGLARDQNRVLNVGRCHLLGDIDFKNVSCGRRDLSSDRENVQDGV
jgi:hypothetical protein